MIQPEADLLQRAQELGAKLTVTPAERIVITGFAQITSLGNTEETWQGLLEGRSGVVSYPDANNSFVKIASPVKFSPEEYFDVKQLKGLSPLNAMAIVIAKEAARNAGLIGEDGVLKPAINRREIGSWVGSGIGSTQHLIDVYKITHKDGDSREEMEKNSRQVPPTKGLEIFPEELNAGITRALGISGWGGSSVEACATGLSNPVEAAEKIRSGILKGAFAGGFENPLEAYPEVGIGIFAGMRIVLSKRNYGPELASRPFDKDRDGFVLGAGGGIVVMEEYEHAKKHDAPILAEVLDFRKSMDGGESATSLDVDNVARTILEALWDEKHKRFYEVDAIFTHATSTKEGDLAEANVFRRVFGDKLKDIPIAAIKSNLGHLVAGAGVVNMIGAINALREGKIPHIINLENPDPEVEDLLFVRGKPLERDIKTALVLAYGFGGHNAVMVLGKANQNYDS